MAFKVVRKSILMACAIEGKQRLSFLGNSNSDSDISDHKGKKGVMGELNCRGWPKNMAYRTLLKKGRMDLIEEYKLDNLEKED